MRWIWRGRSSIEPCDFAVACGCIAGLAVLLIPFLQATWMMRFQLMTPVPGAFLLAFGMTRIEDSGALRKLSRGLAAVVGLLALSAPLVVQGPVITDSAAQELKAFRPEIDNPADTLIVAPHGAEFWAGFILHTKVKSGEVPENIQNYQRVLLLQPTPEFDRRRRPPHGFGAHNPAVSGAADRLQPNHELVIPDEAEPIYRGTHFDLFELPVHHQFLML